MGPHPIGTPAVDETTGFFPADAILAEAVDIPCPRARRAFVDRACGGRPEVLREVEWLLENHFRAGDFLDGPAAGLTPRSADGPDRVGSAVGPYTLRERLGEGGWGSCTWPSSTPPSAAWSR